MNPNPTLAEARPIKMIAAEFLAAFHPGPYYLRTFSDGGKGGGKNYQVSAAELATVDFLAGLHLANQGDRQGVFFVVNPGGHRDETIADVAAHFVEAEDLPLEQQYANLLAFPLEPSIIVKTRKSLHGYWLIKNTKKNHELDNKPINNLYISDNSGKSGDEILKYCLAQFPKVQKSLAAVFQGEPVISNPSRVMRLSGFYHSKQEPVLVSCLKFDPQLRYTQAEIGAAIAAVTGSQALVEPSAKHSSKIKAPDAQAATPAAPEQSANVSIPEFSTAADVINPQRMIRSCVFLSHAKTTAATLSEPLWYAMITQLAGANRGASAIHVLSREYPGYTAAATDKKIAQFIKTGAAPMTCETLRGWGYHCPRLGSCPVKAPWELGKTPLPIWYVKKPNGYRLKPGVLANELAKHKRIFYAGEAYYQYLGGVYKMVDDRHCQKIVRYDLISQGLLPHDPGGLSTIQLQAGYDETAVAPIFMAFLADCLDADTQRLIQEIFGYLLIPETCAQKAFVFVGEGRRKIDAAVGSPGCAAGDAQRF